MGLTNKRKIEPAHAFLLRCWQEPDEEGKNAWRFSLTHINKERQRKGFVNLEALVAYLGQILPTANNRVSGGNQAGKNNPSR
jgi:hypothetical protein